MPHPADAWNAARVGVRDAALTNIRIVPLVERDARLYPAARGTRDHAALRAGRATLPRVV